jgi:RNA-directed DNA polymerase
LLANIVLNQLDWQLHERGYQFVRYADDFLVICQSPAQAEGARHFVQQVLATFGLQLSVEKSRISTYRQAYSFLGFVLASHSRRMRPKSLQKFKDKVRMLTIRHHNFEPQVIIEKLNRVLQGTSRYFATSFSTCRWLFQKLDSWIRLRLRCMKFKRKRATDNYKLRNRTFYKLGLFSMEQFCIQQQPAKA